MVCRHNIHMAPTPLMHVQVSEHAKLKFAVHHGYSRVMDPLELAEADVIITSYETLRSEHKQQREDGLLG